MHTKFGVVDLGDTEFVSCLFFMSWACVVCFPPLVTVTFPSPCSCFLRIVCHSWPAVAGFRPPFQPAPYAAFALSGQLRITWEMTILNYYLVTLFGSQDLNFSTKSSKRMQILEYFVHFAVILQI